MPGYVTRVGYPKFFMPSEEAARRSAANASRAMIKSLASDCSKLQPKRLAARSDFESYHSLLAALPARRQRDCREALELLAHPGWI